MTTLNKSDGVFVVLQQLLSEIQTVKTPTHIFLFSAMASANFTSSSAITVQVSW